MSLFIPDKSVMYGSTSVPLPEIIVGGEPFSIIPFTCTSVTTSHLQSFCFEQDIEIIATNTIITFFIIIKVLLFLIRAF